MNIGDGLGVIFVVITDKYYQDRLLLSFFIHKKKKFFFYKQMVQFQPISEFRYNGTYY